MIVHVVQLYYISTNQQLVGRETTKPGTSFRPTKWPTFLLRQSIWNKINKRLKMLISPYFTHLQHRKWWFKDIWPWKNRIVIHMFTSFRMIPQNKHHGKVPCEVTSLPRNDWSRLIYYQPYVMFLSKMHEVANITIVSVKKIQKWGTSMGGPQSGLVTLKHFGWFTRVESTQSTPSTRKRRRPSPLWVRCIALNGRELWTKITVSEVPQRTQRWHGCHSGSWDPGRMGKSTTGRARFFRGCGFSESLKKVLIQTYLILFISVNVTQTMCH